MRHFLSVEDPEFAREIERVRRAQRLVRRHVRNDEEKEPKHWFRHSYESDRVTPVTEYEGKEE